MNYELTVCPKCEARLELDQFGCPICEIHGYPEPLDALAVTIAGEIVLYSPFTVEMVIEAAKHFGLEALGHSQIRLMRNLLHRLCDLPHARPTFDVGAKPVVGQHLQVREYEVFLPDGTELILACGYAPAERTIDFAEELMRLKVIWQGFYVRHLLGEDLFPKTEDEDEILDEDDQDEPEWERDLSPDPGDDFEEE